jgi:hypothetical protein
MKRISTNKKSLLNRIKRDSGYPAERVEAADMQEHFSDTVPQRDERPAADVLAEAETKSAVLVFIP